jgi:hypothetical protein
MRCLRFALTGFLGLVGAAAAEDPASGPWVDLLDGGKLETRWKKADNAPGATKPFGDWYFSDAAKVAPDNERRLAGGGQAGGILINGVTGKTKNLYTKEPFGDAELHCEFMIPKGSNAGLKFHGWYEIQILDSYGSTKPLSGADCGGIYPRSELKPRYHHIDEGIAPLVNACGAPGSWQTLDVEFRAPRFAADGSKSANARITKATLNGKVIHKDLELQWPTGSNWKRKEVATGPLMLQADHGPIAVRVLKVRPLSPGPAPAPKSAG